MVPKTLTSASKAGFPYRAPDVHLGELVRGRLRPELLKRLAAAEPDVHLIEACLCWDVPTLAAGEVIDDGELVAAPQKITCHVRPDKPCPAGEENPHHPVGGTASLRPNF
jgi:hypothetical protein